MKPYGKFTGSLMKHHRSRLGLSQSDLGFYLGYRGKAGQLISNVERGYCNLPPKLIVPLAEILKVSVSEIKEAIIKDLSACIDFEIMESKNDKVVQSDPIIQETNSRYIH